MMKRSVLLALGTSAVVTLAAAPGLAHAQGVGVGVRAGTFGLGVEGAVGLGQSLVVRGGVGLTRLPLTHDPFEVEATFDDLEVTLLLPEDWYHVGIDYYLNGAVRVGAGMLFKPSDPGVRGEYTTSQDIGGRFFTGAELGTLTGKIDSDNRAPYVLLGFGKHTSGIGLFLDLGLAFLGDPQVSLDSEGGTFPDPVELRARLDAEAETFEENMATYMKYWPILNLGIRIGLGG